MFWQKGNFGEIGVGFFERKFVGTGPGIEIQKETLRW
jgi:hypothetical protein